MLGDGKIRKEDLELLIVTDSPQEAVDAVVRCYEQNCNRVKEQSEGAQIVSPRSAAGGGMRSPYRNARKS